MVDSAGNVFLEEENEETGETQQLLIDPDEIEKPTFRSTVVYRLPVWAFEFVKSKVTGKVEDSEVKSEKSEKEPLLDVAANGTQKKRKSKAR